MPYSPYYPGGWQTGIGGATPGSADALNNMEDGIVAAQDAIDGLDPIPKGVGWLWFTNTAPALCLLLRGQAINRTTYAELFALWGTLYGAGDGSTTFNVPNLEGRIPIGKATSGTAGTLGGTFGALDHAHGVSLTTGASSHNINAPAGAVWLDYATSAHVHGVTGNTAPANPPALVVNFIAYTGV